MTLRVKVLKELAKGVKHLYALATQLREHFSTVHNVLENLKNAGIIEIEATGPRTATYYKLTSMGRQVLALLDWVEAHGAVEPSELKKIFGEGVVNAALSANLLETRVEKIKLQRLIPDAPPEVAKEGSWIKCTRCGEFIDITGHPMFVTCSKCRLNYKHRDINWAIVVLKALWGAIEFGFPGSVGGSLVGYFVNKEDRIRGAEIGAKAAGFVSAVIGAIKKGLQAYEEERQSDDYIPLDL